MRVDKQGYTYFTYFNDFKKGQWVVAVWKSTVVCGKIDFVRTDSFKKPEPAYNFYKKGFKTNAPGFGSQHDAGWYLESKGFKVTLCEDAKEAKSIFLGACL